MRAGRTEVKDGNKVPVRSRDHEDREEVKG
jgi:hypothetical protein